MSDITTKQAIEKLTKELKADPGYFMAWQANIAMAFKDECRNAGVQFPQLHEIVNQAAVNFLNLLCMDVSND